MLVQARKMCMDILRAKARHSIEFQQLWVNVCAFLPGKFIPTRRTPGVSTSELLERIVSGYRKRDFDEKLTRMGHAELRAEGSDYDEQSSRYASRLASRSGSPTHKPAST